MTEKRRLFHSGSENNGRSDYGSIPYKPLRQGEEDEDIVNVRFVFRKSDAIVVSVLLVLVAASILTTLLIGIPNIRRKNDAANVLTPDLLTSRVTGAGLTTKNPLPLTYPPVSARGEYASAAVSTNCPECSSIATQILKQNGSTMDAAIAATICVSVADPHHTGLGGGFLMTVYDRKSKTAQVIDARETAPSLATENMFQGNPELASKGGLSVAIPGLVKGLWVAHQMYGKLKWSELIAPSIPLCSDGFPVRLSLASALQSAREDILSDQYMRSVFTNTRTRDVLGHGQLVKQPTLAKTLKILAENGGDEFYFGELAKNLTSEIQVAGGIITLRDFQNYTVKVKEPVTIDTDRGYKIFSVPPPGSGALVQFFFNILDGYNLTGRSLEGSQEAILTYHRIVEAFKHLYAKRTHLADPDFVDVSELVTNLTSKEYAKHIRSLIRDDVTYPPEYYGAETLQDDHGTSHVSVVGTDGDAVVITSTINQKFGARFMSASSGIIFNDEMDDFASPNVTNFFDVEPSAANLIQPGKRPLSSMCPTIVVDAQGDVTLATGASGGIRITSSTAYVMLRHLYFGESPQMATDASRIHHQLIPNEIEVENGLPGVILDGLRKIGHVITMIDRSPTAVNSIAETTDGGLDAVGDRRVDARVNGF